MVVDILFESRIVSEFTGWTFNASFVLANGQVWKQLDYDIYFAEKSNPVARIVVRDGFTYLEVNGHRTLVRRVK